MPVLDHAFERLERLIVFRFSLFGMEIEISNTLFVMWIIMAVLIVLAFLFTRKLSYDHPGKRQALVEWLVSSINSLCKSSIGRHGRAFVPYIGTLMLYLMLSNIIAVFNFIPGIHLYPPTKDINSTAALAIMSLLVTLYAAFRYVGFKGWAKTLVEPMVVIAPFKLMEYMIKPLSLCLRLFGNVLAGFFIMEIILSLAPYLGAPFSAYFDLFDGVLQAFIFVYLTTLYIGEAVEGPSTHTT